MNSGHEDDYYGFYALPFYAISAKPTRIEANHHVLVSTYVPVNGPDSYWPPLYLDSCILGCGVHLSRARYHNTLSLNNVAAVRSPNRERRVVVEHLSLSRSLPRVRHHVQRGLLLSTDASVFSSCVTPQRLPLLRRSEDLEPQYACWTPSGKLSGRHGLRMSGGSFINEDRHDEIWNRKTSIVAQRRIPLLSCRA